jgi:Cu-processing system permease protein
MLTIAHLTLVDATRRRIVAAALLVGLAFLAIYGTGIFFVARTMERQNATFLNRQVTLALLTVAGCYAANFLSALFALLLPVDALSGEIDSGVIQTIAAKPVSRAQIVIGKWLGFGVVVGGYALLITGGVFVAARLMAGYVPTEVVRILLLMLLEVALLLTISIAGGTRFGTVTNGVVACGVFGLGLMGGWVEQIGALARIESARNFGIAISLITPADSLWRLGSYYLQPQIVRDLSGPSPFAAFSVPNALMVWWAAGMTLALLALAIHQFSRRAL